jgi:hypothetical protein
MCKASHKARHLLLGCRLVPPSPPAEKAAARQDQAGQASTGDGTGDADRIRMMMMMMLMVVAAHSADVQRRFAGQSS